MRKSHVALAIEEWLVSYLSQRLGIPTDRISIGQPFVQFGLASIEGITLVKQLGDWLGVSLSATLAWDYPTIEALARHLTSTQTVSKVQVRVDTDQRSQSEQIAIIGIGCRFPGARNTKEFWQLLCDGRDAITEVPAGRWNVDTFFSPNPTAPGKMVSRWGGFLEDLDTFDAPFFGFSPREAAQLDPRQRLILEVAWEALEDAGIPSNTMAGSTTGVFVATLSANYGSLIFDNFLNIVDAYSGTGNGNSVVANRLSYFLDLRGPSLAVDTACSGALVALHLACQSLQRGESTLAFAGGVNVLLKPDDSVFFSKTGALSPDGRCKVFDQDANGIVRSEGAGIVVLKPLTQALADHDPIYAVIRGSAVNQDGSTNGILAPNGQSQEAMLREAYRRAGVSPSMVQFIEAHGTGTAVGDPIEVNALATVLSEERPPERPCALGSVKTNIGHTEAAAGIAGVIKVALALKYRRLPPNLHFHVPNPRIPFQQLPLFVQQTLGPWPAEREPLIAGVSGFGFAGTNAHVVLEEAPPTAESTSDVDLAQPYVLPLSARSPQALQALVTTYQEFILAEESNVSLLDICNTASTRRSHFEHRLALVAHSREELATHFAAFLQGESRPGLFSGSKHLDSQPRLAFVFSGQGSHWYGMGASLFERELVFRATIEHCDRLARQYVSWSLLEELTAADAESRLDETDIAQPAIFAIQVALASLWLSWGIVPDVIVGQSLGEVAAAHVAGALTLEDALRVVCYRSRLMKQVAGQGKTAVVGLDFEQAQLVLTGLEDLVSVAGTNSPKTSVIAGEPDALEHILHSLERQGVFCRLLKGVDVAFHSPQLEPLKGELVQLLQGIQPLPEAVPIFSTVSGGPISGTQFDASYWGGNLREPFLFTDALTGLISSGYDTFLEISPHPVLTPSILETLAHVGKKGVVVPSLRRMEGEEESLRASIGALYVAGLPIDWHSLYKGKRRPVALPTYPWQRERYWFDQLLDGSEPSRFEPNVGKNGTQPKKAGTHPLLGEHMKLAHPAGQHVWEIDLSARSVSYLDEHRVQGAVILPGATYVEMALAAATQSFGPGVYPLENMVFKQALFLPADVVRRVEVVLAPAAPGKSSFQIFSRLMGATDAPDTWVLHATGIVCHGNDVPDAVPELASVVAIQARCVDEIDGATHYQAMASRGLQYGPNSRTVEMIWYRTGEALGRLQLPAALGSEISCYQIHPVLLDASFHVVAATSIGPEYEDDATVTRIPVGVESVVVYQHPGDRLWCHARLRSPIASDTEVVTAEVVLFDEAGQVIALVSGLHLQRLEGASRVNQDQLNDWLYELCWQPKGHAASQSLPLSADYLLGTPHILERLKRLVDPLSAQHELIYYQEMWPYFDAICAAYIVKALYSLGWDFPTDQCISTTSLAEQLGIVTQHQRLLGRLLEILQEDGVLRHADGGWTVREVPQTTDPEELWQETVDRFPGAETELRLLKRSGQRLADVLSGACDPLQVLFPDESDNLLETLYKDSTFTRVYNTFVQEAVSVALERLPHDRVVRILEIGAGTGSTTSYVLPTLPADQTEYVFTDLSRLLMLKAEPKFSDYRFVKYQQLDIEQDPALQGFDQPFDVILAANVLHATSDLRQALGHIRELLAPEGLLILLEGAKPQRWLDLIVGGTEGWWKFTDVDIRPSYPLLSQQEWQNLLGEMGFRDAVGITDVTRTPPLFVTLAKGSAVKPEFADAESVSSASPQAGSWLILADSGGMGNALVDCLRSRGERCVLVRPGKSYRRLASEDYQVNPGRPQDFRQLLEDALGGQPQCRGVVHLWSLNSTALNETTMASLEEAQTLGSISAMYLIQALLQGDQRLTPRLWLVTRGAQPIGAEANRLALAQSPVWGFGRVFSTEHPELWGGLIDLDCEPSPNEVAMLFSEIWDPDGEDQVAFRREERFAARLERSSAARAGSQPLQFRADGSYLITGGLGGLGLEVARWMVEHGARRLILMNRTPLPPRSAWTDLEQTDPLTQKVAAVRSLEAMGVSIHLASVDVSDEAHLAAFLSQYKRDGWPPIRGVIHAAGLVKDQLLMRMDRATFDVVIRPKIFGSWLLHSLLVEEPLDFFILFSSGTALLGTLGQSNYAAGNVFMDALAHCRRAQGLPAMSINWGVWAEVGIVARMNLKGQLAQNGLIDITPERGLEVLSQLFQYNPTQIAAMPTDWLQWSQAHPRGHEKVLFSQVLRDEPRATATNADLTERDLFQEQLLRADPAERQSLIESYLQALVNAVMRLDPARLDPDLPLNRLGLDSIMAVELKNRVEAGMGVTLSVVDLLQDATLAQLATRIQEQRTDESEIVELLTEIEQLSINEAQALLNTSN